MNIKIKKVLSYTLSVIIVASILYAIGWILKPVLGITSNFEVLYTIVLPGILAAIFAPIIYTYISKKRKKSSN